MFRSVALSRSFYHYSQNQVTKVLSLIALVLVIASTSQAEIIVVPPGGDIQAAINSASCGDTIQLQAGAAFPINGGIHLPNKVGCSQVTTITTTNPAGIPAALTSGYPSSYSYGTFTRLTPAMA